jgi:large conductance mechanosensitive channel
MLQEFKDFITKGNIIEVAVGLIMALYFQAIIDSLLEGVLYPIIAAIFGKPDFRAIGFDLGDAFISIGLVIDAVISFVIVAFILFLVLKGYNKMKDDAAAEDSGPSETDLLTEIRDQLRANNS